MHKSIDNLAQTQRCIEHFSFSQENEEEEEDSDIDVFDDIIGIFETQEDEEEENEDSRISEQAKSNIEDEHKAFEA